MDIEILCSDTRGSPEATLNLLPAWMISPSSHNELWEPSSDKLRSTAFSASRLSRTSYATAPGYWGSASDARPKGWESASIGEWQFYKGSRIGDKRASY